MNLTTFASRAAAALVAAVAGFSSYEHISQVARDAGEHQAVAVVLPLAIDGLIVVGTMAMLEDKRAGRQPRLSARVALGFGIVATIAANIASAQPTVTARLVAAVPAISFLLAVEVLARTGKPKTDTNRGSHSVTGSDRADTATHSTLLAPSSRPRAKSLTAAAKVQRAAAKLPGGTVAQIAARAGVSERTVRRYMPAPTGAAPAETRVNAAAAGVPS